MFITKINTIFYSVSSLINILTYSLVVIKLTKPNAKKKHGTYIGKNTINIPEIQIKIQMKIQLDI